MLMELVREPTNAYERHPVNPLNASVAVKSIDWFLYEVTMAFNGLKLLDPRMKTFQVKY